MENNSPNGGGDRPQHSAAASSDTQRPETGLRNSAGLGTGPSSPVSQVMTLSGANGGVDGGKGDRGSSARGEATETATGTSAGVDRERGERTALPASKDAWSSLRGKMCLEEMLYETSQRAKVYNRNHYGLLGILKVIRMTDPDLNVLALGTDLTSLGLNLNSPDCLFSSFGSPWSDAPAARDAESLLPSCYLPPVPPTFKLSHLEKFNEHTLFYIFYCCPRLLLQGCAAAELYNRGWQYHKVWKKWFLAEPLSRTAGRSSTGPTEDGKETNTSSTAAEGAGGRSGESASSASSRGSGAEAGDAARETVKREEHGDAPENAEPTSSAAEQEDRTEEKAGEATGEKAGSGSSADLPRWTYFEPATWSRKEFRGVLDLQCFLKAEEVRQSVEEGVRQVRAQQQLQHQQLQQLQQQHQQQVSVQQQQVAAAAHQHFSQHQKPGLSQPQLNHHLGMNLSQSNNAPPANHPNPGQMGAGSALSSGQAGQSSNVPSWSSLSSGASGPSANAVGGGAGGSGGGR
ncbi:Tcc1a22.4, related [Neospora caninum Liverpool]|uniref:Tcc1a22.4, related n=1 Tax=Neospora caninum (strain Liverpool) TaxID=572307 RepID=F0VHJ9_NEOCL|nr:Tcc1a22.4, related [Neospora caninum Liverpool]CBZ53193.1 Tcc1a22.4, related [Neospora caninum Liverpool]CEL67183.1 TPA: Tcc1a22.4, related [Neospora caninum Liverpool]|eukprot:XP_003883225.1 Tcc1a22.4, related [Neospora caninum Liverpool]